MISITFNLSQSLNSNHLLMTWSLLLSLIGIICDVGMTNSSAFFPLPASLTSVFLLRFPASLTSVFLLRLSARAGTLGAGREVPRVPQTLGFFSADFLKHLSRGVFTEIWAECTECWVQKVDYEKINVFLNQYGSSEISRLIVLDGS